MSTIADPRDIIVAPVVSEKSYSVVDQNWYTFLVRPDANKTQIKIAIQQIFNVRVLTVNGLSVQHTKSDQAEEMPVAPRRSGPRLVTPAVSRSSA